MIFSRNVSEALAAVFKGRGGRSRQISGGHGEGETPLPIPNRAVKPLSADGTWPARARESRTPPVFDAKLPELHSLPPDLPAPHDDGAADHLVGSSLPPIALRATAGHDVDL